MTWIEIYWICCSIAAVALILADILVNVRARNATRILNELLRAHIEHHRSAEKIAAAAIVESTEYKQ